MRYRVEGLSLATLPRASKEAEWERIGACRRRTAPTVAHLFFGPFALAAGALQFSARIRATRPVLHRRLGWRYVTSVLESASAGLTFGVAYGIVSWASWLVNLVAVEWWFRRQAVAGSEA